MARLVRIVKTLRNNWKKTTFGIIASYYGINYARDKYDASQLMRAYCEEALKYGQVPLPVGSKPRRITIILNPVAGKGKAKKLFEKYCAPLLHLAGLFVSVIQTESEGQAKGLMEVMDNTDAVVIAGGDGTLSEAITGLLRRQDGDLAARTFPIGILPLGRTNTVGKSLFVDERNNVQFLAEATMAVVREAYRPLDIMRIEVLETEEETPGKPVYAVGRIDWGAFRDAHFKQDKYWYWGTLRSYVTYIFSLYKDITWKCDAELEYLAPCSGCTKCYSQQLQDTGQQQQQVRWWQIFVPRQSNTGVLRDQEKIDYSKVDNPECGNWKDTQISTVDFSLTTANTELKCERDGPPHLEVCVGPENVSSTDFVSEGWKRESGENPTVVETLKVRELVLKPKIAEQDMDKERWISIDQEDFEVKPIHVTLLPKKVFMFCSANS